jgi:hypothetical protein
LEGHANDAQDVLKAVEKERAIIVDGQRLFTRVDDAVIHVKVGDVTRDVIMESKGWAPEKVELLFQQSIVGSLDELKDPKLGQLFKDIVDMEANADYGKIVWNFDARSTGKEKEYLGKIKSLLEHPKVAAEFKKTLNYDQHKWTVFVADFETNFGGFIKVIP